MSLCLPKRLEGSCPTCSCWHMTLCKSDLAHDEAGHASGTDTGIAEGSSSCSRDCMTINKCMCHGRKRSRTHAGLACSICSQQQGGELSSLVNVFASFQRSLSVRRFLSFCTQPVKSTDEPLWQGRNRSRQLSFTTTSDGPVLCPSHSGLTLKRHIYTVQNIQVSLY